MISHLNFYVKIGVSFLSVCLISLSTSGFTVQRESPSSVKESRLSINNRILVQVHNKTLSVLDVKKKMDIRLLQEHPELSSNPLARYQFYTSHWQTTLLEMIDTELILADAEEKGVKITDGEVRELLIERFGASPAATLSSIGLTYDETRKMLHDELAMQKMIWYRVYSKAYHAVTPQKIRQAYQTYCHNHPSSDEWVYEVLTIRQKNPSLEKEVADKAYQMLQNPGMDFKAVCAILQKEHPDLIIHVSTEYRIAQKNLSEAHRNVLISLPIGTYSKPIEQTSRFEKTQVYRIFFLKEHSTSECPAFTTVAAELKNALLNQAISEETEAYIARLREKFGHPEKEAQKTSGSFTPFSWIS